MTRIALLLSLIASFALAQPAVTRGGALKKRAYQTYSAMTLYVDPTGSDSGSCTSTGAGACLTLGGALNKVPIHIRHAVTVNVAAGTYAEVFRVQGFFVEGSNGAASTASLSIIGTQVTVTPTAGAATGTLTSYTAGGVGGAHGVATVASAGWAVNDFRGRLLQIVSGTGSGQYMPISSNDSSNLSLAANFTVVPTGTSTFAIVTPGPVFTGTQGKIEGLQGAGTVSVVDVSLQPPSGTSFTTSSVSTPIQLTRVRLVGVSSGFLTPTYSALTVTNSYIAGGTGSGFGLSNLSSTSITGSLIYCTGTCAGTGLFNSARASYLSFFTGTVAGIWNTALFTANSGIAIQSTGVWFDCGSASNLAINLPVATDSSAFATGSGWAQNTGPYISGCTTGYNLNNPSLSYIDNGTVFTNVTTAISLTAGARVVLEAGATFTGVTNQISLDGEVFTDANLTTFTRITGPQGSYITRP